MSSTNAIKNQLKPAAKPKKRPSVSTGSTLLNLACSGHPRKGFRAGHYYYMVGDSSSGKTFYTLTCLAEAANNPSFDDYRFIFDAPEDGALMDFKKFFGAKMAGRVEPPATRKGEPKFSDTVEEFYYNLDDAFAGGKPFIYILDSMDSLVPKDDLEKFDELKKAARKAEKKKVAKGEGLSPEQLAHFYAALAAKEGKPTGSYGTAKAKLNSTNIRIAIPKLTASGSILIIISQTRDNIGTFSFEKKTRSGGHALNFYASMSIWLSLKGKVTKKVRDKNRVVGMLTKLQTKKNRLTGRDRSVVVPFSPTYGIDDIGSCVDYLLEEKHWKKAGGSITAPEFGFNGTRDELIKEIEETNSERELQDVTGDVWQQVEEAMTTERKARYE